MKNSDQNQSDNSGVSKQIELLFHQLSSEEQDELINKFSDKRHQSDSSVDKQLEGVNKLHQCILEDCVDVLGSSSTISLEEPLERWVFVFIRSAAIPKTGKESKFRKISKGKQQRESNDNDIEKYLNIQYQISPELRTYNELLVNRGSNEGIGLSLSFSFDGSEPLEEQGDIHFDNKQIEEAVSCLNFDCFEIDKVDEKTYLKDNKSNYYLKDNKSNYQKIKKLNKRRESISLTKTIREKFWSSEESTTGEEDSFSNLELEENISEFSLPDELRYAIQVLILWSRSMNWQYIETYHSCNDYDTLSGLVVSVCSSGKKLKPEESDKIKNIIQKKSKELSNLVRQKTMTLPKSPREKRDLENKLNTYLPNARDDNDNLLWSGEDAFYVIQYLKDLLFSAAFEGVPESYSFILGHPGFIKRPKSIGDEKYYPIKDIRKNRELSDGLLDKLNVIDIFNNNHPDGIPKLDYVPIPFPAWAKQWDDIEQASGSVLARLSLVHRETIVVGLLCKQVMMIYKAGELVCVFDGAWKMIQSWDAIVDKLKPINVDDNEYYRLKNNVWLKRIYQIMINIAYGPSSRSIIVGYIGEQVVDSTKTIDEFIDEFIEQKKDEVRYFSENSTQWPMITSVLSLELSLLQASKTDGAILISSAGDNLQMRSRLRIIIDDKDAKSSGTGDATAAAMAKQWTIVTMKVSRDGGLKVRYNGQCERAETLFV